MNKPGEQKCIAHSLMALCEIYLDDMRRRGYHNHHVSSERERFEGMIRLMPQETDQGAILLIWVHLTQYQAVIEQLIGRGV